MKDETIRQALADLGMDETRDEPTTNTTTNTNTTRQTRVVRYVKGSSPTATMKRSERACYVAPGANLSMMGEKGKAALAGSDTWREWRKNNCDCERCVKL